MLTDKIRKLDGDLDVVTKELGTLADELDSIGRSVEKLEESFVRLRGALSR